MGVWEYGSMGVWEYGSMGVWGNGGESRYWGRSLAQGVSGGRGEKRDSRITDYALLTHERSILLHPLVDAGEFGGAIVVPQVQAEAADGAFFPARHALHFYLGERRKVNLRAAFQAEDGDVLRHRGEQIGRK